jgi:GNAT superfamily N-acetyltransferase
MIYYKDSNITIRSMEPEDVQIIYNELLAQNWHPSIETYEKYYNEQVNNQRFVFIAEHNGQIAGLTTLLPSAVNGPFANLDIPEIVDFVVFIKYQKKGIGNKILDVAEKKAAEITNKVSLGVGLHSGYGAAQRIYVKRGYIPDGSGVWYNDKQLGQYVDCCNDDELILYFSKSLVVVK